MIDSFLTLKRSKKCIENYAINFRTPIALQ